MSSSFCILSMRALALIAPYYLSYRISAFLIGSLNSCTYSAHLSILSLAVSLILLSSLFDALYNSESSDAAGLRSLTSGVSSVNLTAFFNKGLEVLLISVYSSKIAIFLSSESL